MTGLPSSSQLVQTDPIEVRNPENPEKLTLYCQDWVPLKFAITLSLRLRIVEFEKSVGFGSEIWDLEFDIQGRDPTIAT